MSKALIKFEDLEIPALTVIAQEQYEECLWAIEKALKKQLEFGRILLIVKGKLPHGQWGKWVRETFEDHKSLRTIQRHMRGAEAIATDPSLLDCADSLDGVLKIVEERKPTVEVIDVASEVAAELGVTREQIIQDGKFAEAVEVVAKTDPDIRAKVRAGKVSQDEVIAAAATPKPANARKSPNELAAITIIKMWQREKTRFVAAKVLQCALQLIEREQRADLVQWAMSRLDEQQIKDIFESWAVNEGQ